MSAPQEREPAGPLRIRSAVESDLPELAQLLGGEHPAPQLPADGARERLLVAETAAADGRGTRLLATVRLRAAVGLELPRCAYHVGCVVHAAPALRLFHRQRTLWLGNDHTGASELAALAAAREGLTLAERASALRWVVQAALLVLASRREEHAAQLIAELPGRRDAAGQSPFWQGLGRHFYGGDPAAAAQRFGADWRSLVAALLPRHPVYVSFLPPAAQAAIAQVHDDALPQREVLEAAGLRYGHHIAIDDGGPILEAEVDALPGVAAARRLTVAAAAGSGAGGARPLLVQQTQHDADGREQIGVVRLRGAIRGGRLLLEPAQHAPPALAEGTPVWVLPLRSD